ncbi:MAG: paraslipin [Leptospiraceae bacterium]|nr:paraslipin [Leptospiraceae bacterium]
MGYIFFLSAAFLIVAIIIITRTFIVVPHQHIYIQERLGKFHKELNSGFHFLIPIIDQVAYEHTMKEQVIDVPPQICITKDNVQVEVDGVLYIRVMDARKASYGIDRYAFASSQLAQTSMRSEIGKLNLDATFKERETINDAIVKAVDSASDPWGVKVTRYEIKNITPPQTVINAMELQMRAEREKRAEILHSEGERQYTINLSEGERQESINMSEGEKQRYINEAEGQARQIELVADATANALKVVADAIAEPGGKQAKQLRIAEQYIRQFGDIVQTSKTTVVPLSVANIQGAFEGFSKVMGAIGPDATTAGKGAKA